MGEYRQVPTDDGAFAVYLEMPKKSPAPAVVVLQEIFGINDDMRETCRELANQGFVALCPDLFWRQEPGVALNSWLEAEWKKGLSLYQNFNRDLGVEDTGATISTARSLPECNGKAGVMGFCLGGLMTFLTAARTDVDAASAYYGGETDQYLAEANNCVALASFSRPSPIPRFVAARSVHGSPHAPSITPANAPLCPWSGCRDAAR